MVFALFVGVLGIGINYGLLGDNLPPAAQVVGLLRSRGVSKIRIFDPNSDVLKALGNTGISVIVGTRNEDLESLSKDPSYATKWVKEHIAPYASSTKIAYVSAGNEVIPGPLADYVLNAMQNLYAALVGANLNIPVTTAVAMNMLGNSYPPSAGVFSDDSIVFMTPISTFLSQQGTPLLVNVYPYFAYVGNRDTVPLSYALLQHNAPPVIDGSLQYDNLFHSMVDAVYSALDKVGASGVEVIVSETGWPSSGDQDATYGNAQTYNNNVIALESSRKGTPKRPGKAVQTYIFALFNENMKPAGTEQNFGLYHPDMTEVYHVNIPA